MPNIITILLLLIVIYLLFCKSYGPEHFENKKYKFGILICCYNRPEYLEKTLISLKNTKLDDAIVYIIDDNSTNPETIKLINDFYMPNVTIKKERNNENLGISKSLEKGFTYLNTCCEFLTNLDSDVVLKPNWLQQLYKVYLDAQIKFPNSKHFLISGFNCTSTCAHKIYRIDDSFHEKKTIGGINTFFHNNFFKDYVTVLKQATNKNHGWDDNLCTYCNKNSIPILVTNPSVVQHIGFNGLNSNGMRADVADDF